MEEIALERNKKSYNALLVAYESESLLEKALDAFNDIKRNGLQPDVNSFTFLIKLL